MIDRPCTNERFTSEDYVRANCEYPGEWDGELCSIIAAEKQTILITRVWPRDKIASLTEYRSDDGPAPKWRQNMGIGKPIDGKA